MSILLAVIAFFIAFGALWFTSELARRLELNSRTSSHPHLGSLQDSLRRAERQVRELSRSLDAAEQKIRFLDARTRNLTDGTTEGANDDARHVDNVTALDIIRGASGFYPSDTIKN